MPSIGDKATASAEKRVQDRLVKIYSKARKDMMEQMKEFNARFAQKDQEKRARVKSGQMTQEEYDKWKRMQVLQSDIWRQKVEQATKTLEDANRQALRVINGEKMDVFAENANYEAYRLSKETGIGYGFSVYDKDTVGKLIREQPELMPPKVVNGKKDRAWNRTKISNAVTQSIIEGDSLPEMTERIARETAHENDAAMARYAATAMTSAQNAGRMETMERAKGMGIKVRKKWIATLDARTRDSHAELDGQVVDIDQPFITHNRDGSLAEIMFPGDPQADGEQVWNCRCTLGYVYEEYPDEEDAERIAAEYYRDEDDNLRSRPAYVKNMSYEQWVEYKQNRIGQMYGEKPYDEVFKQKTSYTDSEKDAIHEYTTSAYSGVNSALREGTVEKYDKVKAIVEEIDKAMEKTVVREGTVASRGASMADLRGMFEDKKRSWFEDPDNLKSLEGQTATFKSYISATKGESVAEQYKRELQWHFTTEGEIHGIDAEQFASSSVKSEREIVFDRDAQIEIEKVKVNVDSDGDIDGVIEIWAKIKKANR